MAAKMAVSKMIARGWLPKGDATLRRNKTLWRETGDGHGTPLVVTGSAINGGSPSRKSSIKMGRPVTLSNAAIRAGRLTPRPRQSRTRTATAVPQQP